MKTFLKAAAGLSAAGMIVMGIKVLWDKHQQRKF